MIGNTWLRPRDNPALFFVVLLALFRMDKTLKEKGAGTGVEDETASWSERNGSSVLFNTQAELAGRKKETYGDLEMQLLGKGSRKTYTAFFRHCVQVNGYSINAAVLLSDSEDAFFRLIVVKIKRLLRKVAGLLQDGEQRCPTPVTRSSRSSAARVSAVAEEVPREQQQGGADAAGLSAKSSDSDSNSDPLRRRRRTSDSDSSESESESEDKSPPRSPHRTGRR